MRIKGDDGDGSSEVSDYVEQLRLGLIQQAAGQRISWLESFNWVVAQKEQEWEAFSCGRFQVLDTTNWRWKRWA